VSFSEVYLVQQFRVKIKDKSTAYFNHIVAFELLYRWTSVKGGIYARRRGDKA